jgi:hypothetical protein
MKLDGGIESVLDPLQLVAFFLEQHLYDFRVGGDFDAG